MSAMVRPFKSYCPHPLNQNVFNIMITQLSSVLLLGILVSSTFVQACPTFCICKWRNGKQTVECLGGNLLRIPLEIDTATQVLDVSGNNLQRLVKENFLRLGLINLQKLFLSRCSIIIVDDDAFKGLSNLVELDLSENLLTMSPIAALLSCPSLMRLSLSKNPIELLERLAFNHLSFLTTLDLSQCQISEVDEAAFKSLYSLEWLDLSGNRIKTFPDMRLFPIKLKGVQLHDNPWQCDCNIRVFNDWLRRDVVPILMQPVCSEPPRLRAVQVRSLEEQDLACSPELSPASFYFESEEGRNVTLICQVKSQPQATITWKFNNQEVNQDHTIETNPQTQESTLFIYNITNQSNGTFHCIAKNPAGTTWANYTISVRTKTVKTTRQPIRIQENHDTPFDWLSLVLAAALVCACLCLVALVMAIVKCKSQSKRRELDSKDGIVPVTVPRKSILKKSGGGGDVLGGEIGHAQLNPDILKGIGRFSGQSTVNLRQQPVPIMVTPANLSRRTGHHQQPYLKPTLTSKCRPVSAPTFERYVEDRRYTADGYLQTKHFGLGFYSEKSTPRRNTRFRDEDLVDDVLL